MRPLPAILPLLLSLFSLLSPIDSQWVTPSPYEGPASLPTPDWPSSPTSPPTFNFTSTLTSLLSLYSIPGAVVSLISLSPTSPHLTPSPLCPFHVAALSSAGVRRLTSPTPTLPSDAYHHGSNTKAMTALLISRMVERGRLRWNQTAASVFPYLPWGDGTPSTPSSGYFSGSPYVNLTLIHPTWHHVTIAHLCTHTSGLLSTDPTYSSWQGAMQTLERAIPLPGLYRINSSWPLYPIPSRQWFLSRLLTAAVTSPPTSVNLPSSAGYSYNNFNYVLLGCIMEELEGKAWDVVMQDTLFDPLGMLSAGSDTPPLSRTVHSVSQPYRSAFIWFVSLLCPAVMGHLRSGDISRPLHPSSPGLTFSGTGAGRWWGLVGGPSTIPKPSALPVLYTQTSSTGPD